MLAMTLPSVFGDLLSFQQRLYFSSFLVFIGLELALVLSSIPVTVPGGIFWQILRSAFFSSALSVQLETGVGIWYSAMVLIIRFISKFVQPVKAQNI